MPVIYTPTSQPAGNVHAFIWGAEQQSIGGFVNTTYYTAASARSGTRGFEQTGTRRLEIDIPTNMAGLGVGLTMGTLLDLKWRFFFKPLTFSDGVGSGDYAIGGDRGVGPLLKMNSTGHVRLTSMSMSPTTTAYSANTLTLGHWHRVDARTYGYEGIGGASPSTGRRKIQVRVYDCGVGGGDTPVEIIELHSRTALESTLADHSGLSVTAFATAQGSCGGSYQTGMTIPFGSGFDYGWLTAAAFGCTGATVAGSTPLNGGGWVIVSDGQMQDGCASFYNGGATAWFLEEGTMAVFNEPFGNFQPHNVGLAYSWINMGDEFGGGSGALMYYDDFWWQLRLGDQVTNIDFPHATHVLPIVGTAQGTHNDFLPSGAYNKVNRIPDVDGVGSGFPNTSTLNAQTSYFHQPLPASLVYHIRCYTNWTTASGTQTVVINGVEYPHGSQTGATHLNQDNIDLTTTPMTDTEFAALEFGVKNTVAGSLTLWNIILEVLADDPIMSIAGVVSPTATESHLVWKPTGATLDPNTNAVMLMSRVPNGTEGTIYEGLVAASSTPEAIPWTYDVLGDLPPGLTLDANTGNITGVATRRGLYTFSIRASHRD